MSRVRAHASALLVGLIAASCSGGPMDSGRAVPLDIAPSFQVDPSLFPYDPIDHIRLVARDASTSQVVGSSNDPVDPTASQWALSLGIDLGDRSAIDVLVDVELLSQDVVQWSGRVGPIAVPTTRAQSVSLYRGPLENLDVELLAIQDAPAQLVLGSTATTSANATLAAGSDVSPEIFWASSNPRVATVTSTGSVATVTAVATGTADIVASAGAASDAFTVEVVPAVSSVTVSPSSATIVGLDGTQQFTATVTDGFGNSDPNASVSWSSASTAVATVDANGLATSTGIGSTQITAMSGGVSGQASLSVEAAGAPGQKLWVGGTSNDWQDPSNWSPSGVPTASDDVLVPVGANVTLSGDGAAGSLTMEDLASLDLVGFTLSVSGDVDAPYSISNGLVVLTGTGSVLQGVFPDLQIDAARTLSSSLVASGDLVIDNSVFDANGQSLQTAGDLTIQDAKLDLNGGSAIVTGSLLVTGAAAQLSMTVPSSAIYVSGDATFDGGDESGLLTEGAIQIGGNFVATNRSPTGFVASNNNVVNLVGPGGASVSLANPGATGQRFGDVEIIDADAVTFSTGAYMTGDLQVFGSMVVPGGVSVTIEGAITLLAGSTFQVDGTVDARGGCTDQGAYMIGDGTAPCGGPTTADRVWVGGDPAGATDWQNANNWLPAGVPGPSESVFVPLTSDQPTLTQDVSLGSLEVVSGAVVSQDGFLLSVSFDLAVDGRITGGRTFVTDVSSVLYGQFESLNVETPRTLSGALSTSLDLDVSSDLSVGANTVFVGSFLLTEGAGRLIMQDPNANVYVTGNATFAGTSTDGYLTDGTLWVGGDFTATASSPQSFAATAPMEVYLVGAADQTVTLSNPDPAGQRFADLYVVPTAGVRTVFETNAVVTGLLYAQSATLAGAGGASLEVSGVLELYSVTFDGLLLRLVSSQPPDVHVLNSVTFTKMPATQLSITVPGAGSTSPLLLDSPVFTDPPTPGSYYIEATNSSVTGTLLQIELANPMPTDDGGLIKTDALTNIVWGP